MSMRAVVRALSKVRPTVGRTPTPLWPSIALGFTLTLLALTACTGDNTPTEPSLDRLEAVVGGDPVTDLAVASATETTITLRWTQVRDWKGEPASYQLRYAPPPINWDNATIGCSPTMKGTKIGEEMTCTVESLPPGTTHDFQMESFRVQGGSRQKPVRSNIATGQTVAPVVIEPGEAHPVTDLGVTEASESSLTVRWTQVDDGTGEPASYRVKYDTPPLDDWKNATIGCEPTLVGTGIGAPMSCTVEGLGAGTAYDVQLMSFRVVDGVWQGAVYSNIATGQTDAPVVTEPGAAVAVADLKVSAHCNATFTMKWTEVDDGTGRPASYQVRYGPPPITWERATVGCEPTLVGDRIGEEMSCVIVGLDAETTYDVQLMSFRTADGTPEGESLSNIATDATDPDPVIEPGDADPVIDLGVTGASESSLTVRWTQVDDGTGEPASYRVKYDTPSLDDWTNATIGCEPTLVGTEIGAPMSCTIEGLGASTPYDVQLMSFRVVDGVWQGAVYSNLATGQTSGATDPPPPSGASGIWISGEEIAQLPTSGSAWTNLLNAANKSCGTLDLSNQDQSNNVCIMAKALVFARTGQSGYRTDVVQALGQIANSGTYSGRALALGRELAAYAISADLINLASFDPSLDDKFRKKIRELLTTYTNSGPSSLVACHEERPNNWGTHCGASRAAVAAYLGDTSELARAAQVFKGWLGDRSSYAGFKYGELGWQCDTSRPVGINPVGCTRDGHSIDGVLPDDQRRAGGFTWPPPKENYVWEALQGALAQAVILHRAGYPVFEWENRALLRAVQWLHSQADYPAEGDDEWQPWIVNHFYGTNFPAALPAGPGKNVGWTDWTLGR